MSAQSPASPRSEPEPTFVSANRIEREWPGCDHGHVAEYLPPWPEGLVTREEEVSLHEVALHVIVEYTGCSSEEAVLGSSMNALRAVHTIALALSGALRHELEIVELAFEKYARGQAVLGRPTPPTNELLLMHVGKSLWTEASKAKYFSMSYADYAIEYLRQKRGFEPYNKEQSNVAGTAQRVDRRRVVGSNRNNTYALM